MAAACASIQGVWTRLSGTAEKLSGSEPAARAAAAASVFSMPLAPSGPVQESIGIPHPHLSLTRRMASPDPSDDEATRAGPASAAAAVPAAGQGRSPGVARKRPRPGERRIQILQTLASMLEQPGAERVTTAALAARLEVSEAALYRHFASKAQMFEGLIDFIESSIFTLADQIVEREADGVQQARRICEAVLQFGAANPGMTRVMVGDALVLEHERLGERMNQFFDRVESQLRQCLRPAAQAAGSPAPNADAAAAASALVSFVAGRLQRYARSGFRRSPLEHLELALLRLAA